MYSKHRGGVCITPPWRLSFEKSGMMRVWLLVSDFQLWKSPNMFYCRFYYWVEQPVHHEVLRTSKANPCPATQYVSCREDPVWLCQGKEFYAMQCWVQYVSRSLGICLSMSLRRKHSSRFRCHEQWRLRYPMIDRLSRMKKIEIVVQSLLDKLSDRVCDIFAFLPLMLSMVFHRTWQSSPGLRLSTDQLGASSEQIDGC